jgi:hypothetical protein
MTKAELLSLSRDELLAQAVVVGVLNVETKSRADLVDAIAERLGLGVVEVPAAEPTPAARPRGLLGRARALIARVIEKGLHMPSTTSTREAGANTKEPTARAALPTVTLAKIYVAQGHPARAVEVLRQVLVRNPADAEATLLLESLRPAPAASPQPSEPLVAAEAEPEPEVAAAVEPAAEPAVAVEPEVAAAVESAVASEPEVAAAVEPAAEPVVAAEPEAAPAAESAVASEPEVAAAVEPAAEPVVAAEPEAAAAVEPVVAAEPEVAAAVEPVVAAEVELDSLVDEMTEERLASVAPVEAPVELVAEAGAGQPLAEVEVVTQAEPREVAAAGLDQAPSSGEFVRSTAAALNAEAVLASAPKAALNPEADAELPPGPGPQPMLDDRPLPERYDVDEAVLMPVDPTTAYLYWEVRPSTYEQVLATSRAARLVIRLLLSFDGKSARRDIYPDRLFGDVFVDELPDGADMRAVLGFVVGGVFSPLATGPTTASPPATVATRLADSLATWTRATTALLPAPLPAGIALSIALAHTRDQTLEPQLEVLAGLPDLAAALGLDPAATDDEIAVLTGEGYEGRAWLLGTSPGEKKAQRVGRIRAPGARWVGSSEVASTFGSSEGVGSLAR